MRDYEIVYIFRSSLTSEEIEAKLERYHAIIATDGPGEVTASVHWGKRQLAYPIKKQPNGYYVVAQFTSAPEPLRELERVLKLEDDILRYLIVIAEYPLPLPDPAPEAPAAEEAEAEKPAAEEAPAEEADDAKEADADEADADEADAETADAEEASETGEAEDADGGEEGDEAEEAAEEADETAEEADEAEPEAEPEPEAEAEAPADDAEAEDSADAKEE